MTVRKGEAWGEPGGLPRDAPVFTSDRSLRTYVEQRRRAAEPLGIVGLTGGDLCRTLGGAGTVAPGVDADRLRLSVDVVSVLLDGRQHWFVAHLVCRGRGWSGPCLAAMNAEFLGAWDLAPRGHPNDGMVDVTAGSLPLGERLKARRRLPTGSHLPHPSLRTSRVAHLLEEFDKPRPVSLDGEPMGRVRAIALRVEPDALQVVV